MTRGTKPIPVTRPALQLKVFRLDIRAVNEPPRIFMVPGKGPLIESAFTIANLRINTLWETSV